MVPEINIWAVLLAHELVTILLMALIVGLFGISAL